jgi:hypothetical protein
MANLIISDKLARRLQQLAENRQHPVETILEELVEPYIDDPLLDAIPDDVHPREWPAYLKALHEIRPKIYAIAREYWQRVGDNERLALTDAQLHTQFWVIDPDGIPRLKSEQGTIVIPPDPLDDFAELFKDSELTDVSDTANSTLDQIYRKKLLGDQ